MSINPSHRRKSIRRRLSDTIGKTCVNFLESYRNKILTIFLEFFQSLLSKLRDGLNWNELVQTARSEEKESARFKKFQTKPDQEIKISNG